MFHVCDVVPLVPMEHLDISLPLVAAGLTPGFSQLFLAGIIDNDLSPFTHFGTPVALKQTAHGTGIMLVDPKVQPPFEFFVPQGIDSHVTLFKEIPRLLGDMVVKAHAMPTYIGMIGSVLQQWACGYMDHESQSRDPLNIAHLEAQIRDLQKLQEKLMLESMRQGSFAVADATRTASSRISPQQEQQTASAALAALSSQKLELETVLFHMKNPDFIARHIAGPIFNAHVHREIRYHANVKW
jgi:hypothetical protein